MPVLKTVTLGCKVNQYETEYVRQGLIRSGYREANGDERADLCVVNTCTVTLESDTKSRKLIRQLARDNPGAKIVVMGCYATRAAEEVAALPGVSEVIVDKRDLPDLLVRYGLLTPPTGIASFGRLHRALVKVQDGCSMHCSYCIIPKVRPVLSSRPVDEVLDEVRRLVRHGHREIVLTGIHLGHYRAAALDLAGLVRRVLELDLDEPFRVRLSSLEASEVTPELVTLVAEHPDRACPHFHVPIQSGSDQVLQRMRRPWSSGSLIEQCLRIRRLLDTPALTTDVIVGFPGETDADFEATCRLVEEVGFAKVHIFRFSPREGTAAAAMPDQVPVEVKHHRAAELTSLAKQSQRSFARSLLGRPLQVLVESTLPHRPGTLLGTADRYVAVEMQYQEGMMDNLLQVTPSQFHEDRLVEENKGNSKLP